MRTLTRGEPCAPSPVSSPGLLVQFPEHLVLLERLRDRVLDHLPQSRLVQARAQAADMRYDAAAGSGPSYGLQRAHRG